MKRSTEMSIIQSMNQMIMFSCTLLKMKKPEIYYFRKEKNAFVLTDEYLNIISYDSRDMGYTIKNVKFIPKEYVIYINLDIVKNMSVAYTCLLRTTREMFQIKEMTHFKRNKPLDENVLTVKQWLYCLTTRHFKEICLSDTPTEVDKNAYAYVMMGYLFHIELKYEVRDQDRLKTRIDELLRQYKENDVRLLFRKYEIEHPVMYE